MKKNALIPILLGLLLTAACTQENPKTASASTTNSNPQSDIAKAESKPDTTAPAKESVAASTPTSTADQKSASDSSAIVSPAPQTSAPPVVMMDKKDTTAPTSTPSDPASKPADSPTVALSADRSDSAGSTTIATHITEWKLAPEDIKDELEKNGRIERTKAPAPGAPTGAMDSGVLTNVVRNKIDGDAVLSTLHLSIEAQGDAVTLMGSAHSLDQIGRAMAVALDTEGVNRTVSLIRLN